MKIRKSNLIVPGRFANQLRGGPSKRAHARSVVFQKKENKQVIMESRTTFPGLPRWFAFLREAILGSRQDFTEGSIGRAIFMLAVPMILEMAMESLFGIINVFWVSHLGAEARTATATVGVTESLLTLVFGVALGLSMATTATVARRIGEK